MMELLEFLNSCSPLRAVALMIFMLLVLFFTYAFLESVFKIIFGKRNSSKNSDTAEDYYDGPTDNTDT